MGRFLNLCDKGLTPLPYGSYDNMIFVLSKNKKPLMPCSEKRARKLLEQNRAVIYTTYPFTIRLKFHPSENIIHPLRLKIDPGAKTTGLAVMDEGRVLYFAEIEHKVDIKNNLDKRRMLRRSRRSRKTRYRRPPKHEWFRKGKKMATPKQRREGWLPPSLLARVDQTLSVVKKLKSLLPLEYVSVENVKFDTQLMENAEISGVEYQQGTLQGYEVREYLLEKWNRKCAYCGKKDVPLEIEHIIPKSRGGSNRINNLTLACNTCNNKKKNNTAEEFGFPNLLKQAGKSMREVAFMNATRWKLYEELKLLFEDVEFSTGATTKFNRIQLSLPKEHYYDAMCTGKSTPDNIKLCTDYVEVLKRRGRGRHRMVQPDKYGFPGKKPRSKKKVKNGFMTGDIVKITGGKHKEIIGRLIAKEKSPAIEVIENDSRKESFGATYKNLKLIQRNNGWQLYKKTINLEVHN